MTELTEKLPGNGNTSNLGGLGFFTGLVLTAAALALQGAVLYAITRKK